MEYDFTDDIASLAKLEALRERILKGDIALADCDGFALECLVDDGEVKIDRRHKPPKLKLTDAGRAAILQDRSTAMDNEGIDNEQQRKP